MRDPARIERILDLVKEIWTLYPDFRFGQLLINVAGTAGADLYHREDDKLELELVAFRDALKSAIIVNP